MPDTTEYRAPHCDELVLHSPASGCWACALYPDRQAARVRNGVNFTGEHDPAKGPCPAELRRPIGLIARWHGNVAETREEATAHQRAVREAWDHAFADILGEYPDDAGADI